MSFSDKFRRPVHSRPLYTIVYYASEGDKTEKEYMANLGDIYRDIKFKWITSKNSPGKVLSSLENYVANKEVKNKDQLVVIVDKEWEEEDIRAVEKWQQDDPSQRLFIITNPCIELWLLRHYEPGVGASTAQMCKDRLKKYLPAIRTKAVPLHTFERKDILLACKYSRDFGEKNRHKVGFTNMHLLIERLESISQDIRD